jgi:hypothetical protein
MSRATESTNIYCWRSDLDDLDRMAVELFGTEDVPYRATIQRLINHYEETDE